MDKRIIERSLYTCIALCALCLLLCVLALLMRWVEVAVCMAVLALIQAYMVCVWLRRKRQPQRHFRKRTPQEP